MNTDKQILASFAGRYQSDLRWLKASNKALRCFPGSRRQKSYQAQMRAIEALYK